MIVSLAGYPAIVVRVSLTNNLFSIHRVRHLLGDRINDSFKKTGDIISKNKEQIEVTFVIKQLHYIHFVVLIAKGDGSLEREGKRIKVLPFSYNSKFIFMLSWLHDLFLFLRENGHM